MDPKMWYAFLKHINHPRRVSNIRFLMNKVLKGGVTSGVVPQNSAPSLDSSEEFSDEDQLEGHQELIKPKQVNLREAETDGDFSFVKSDHTVA